MDRVALVTVLGVTVVGFFVAANHAPRDVAALEFALGWATRLGGGLVALLALAGLFGQWWRGADAVRLVPGVVVLLAGLAVGSQTWAVAVALGAVTVVLAVPWSRRPSDPSQP